MLMVDLPLRLIWRCRFASEGDGARLQIHDEPIQQQFYASLLRQIPWNHHGATRAHSAQACGDGRCIAGDPHGSPDEESFRKIASIDE